MENTSTRLSYQSKIALSGLIFALTAIGLIYLFILPGVKNVEAIKNQTENQAREAEKSYQQGKNLKSLAENIKAVEPQTEKIQQIFTSKSDLPFFVKSLETTADKNNISEYKPVPGDEITLGQSYSKIPLLLYVSSDFPSLIGFISDLEHFDKYININNLQISVTGKQLKNLTVQISAAAYLKN
jgi:Tfp pilus assembly protein PilO